MVFDRVKALMANQLNIQQDKITMDSNIINDLGADSLDVVEMLMAIEENFGITVPDEDIPSMRTVRDIMNYIEANA